MMAACSTSGARPDGPPARNVVLITIDTLRADHVGAYGWSRARTPTLDALARDGVLFEHAYAAAPITLPSHATLLTGRYPPGHGARDNGMKVSSTVPTLATELRARGFATAAFVAAFPLDHQFGLARGFDVYGDRLPRGPGGRLVNERPASAVIDDAIAWLRRKAAATSPQPPAPFFLWVHLFEPHAPYGDPSSSRPVLERYDEEIATADREVGRLVAALGPIRASTLVVAAGDHGEAFGEHGEFAHSIFVYDTTLRVPLILNGQGLGAGMTGQRIGVPVTLADVAPTVMRLLGASMADVDGLDLTPLIGGAAPSRREIYAESFAPTIEFGWAPLRAVRSGPWKFVSAPTPELFDIDHDPDERTNLASRQAVVVRGLEQRVARYSGDALPNALAPALAPDAAERLRALGYSSGSPINNLQSAISNRPDPKDRRELAARIAQVTSGELHGPALVTALEGIVRDDPGNGQAHLRLGVVRADAGDCPRAEPEFQAAIRAGLPSVDAYLGLASCLGARRDLDGAGRALESARQLEPDNPSVRANIGILQAARGNLPAAIEALSAALATDPDLHEARFNLAVAYLKAGRPADAAATARELLRRLPSDAPQRAEVQRLLDVSLTR